MLRAHALASSAVLMCACAAPSAPACESPGAEATSAAVIASVDDMFAAMREHDAERLTTLLIEGAVIIGVREDEQGHTRHRLVSGADFIAGTAGDATAVVDEHFTATPSVRIDGSIATLWGPYELVVDGERVHCGVDTVQLLREGERWRVTAITYTARPC